MTITLHCLLLNVFSLSNIVLSLVMLMDWQATIFEVAICRHATVNLGEQLLHFYPPGSCRWFLYFRLVPQYPRFDGPISIPSYFVMAEPKICDLRSDNTRRFDGCMFNIGQSRTKFSGRKDEQSAAKDNRNISVWINAGERQLKSWRIHRKELAMNHQPARQGKAQSQRDNLLAFFP